MYNERTQPILPSSNKIFDSEYPLQSLTTQRHDFVFKYRPKRSKIVPNTNLGRLDGFAETMTVHRLSYRPMYGVERTKSFKPAASYQQSFEPFAQETTHKMSFMPVQLSWKEPMPWAEKQKYVAPTVPFAGTTITKLSFQPPGCFVKCPDELKRFNCSSSNNDDWNEEGW